jgi:hypothetical protein
MRKTVFSIVCATPSNTGGVLKRKWEDDPQPFTGRSQRARGGMKRKPRANNTCFRALRRHPKDAVDAGNPLHYNDFPSDAPLAKAG